MEAHFLGLVDYEACLALQQRLVYEVSGRTDGQIALLICEHSNLITIGRHGSRAHICLDDDQLVSRQLQVRWVNRGGGCIVHAPGQLAVYPIVPLAWHGLTVGAYLSRLTSGILSALAQVRVAAEYQPGGCGIWMRGGQVAVVGAAVKNWTTYHGAFINVSPAIQLFRPVQTDALSRQPMSSLAAQLHHPPRMAALRAELVPQLATAFGCGRYHLYTGHPLMANLRLLNSHATCVG